MADDVLLLHQKDNLNEWFNYENVSRLYSLNENEYKLFEKEIGLFYIFFIHILYIQCKDIQKYLEYLFSREPNAHLGFSNDCKQKLLLRPQQLWNVNNSPGSQLPIIAESKRDEINKLYDNLEKFTSIQPIFSHDYLISFQKDYRNHDSVLPAHKKRLSKSRKNQLLFESRLTKIVCTQATSRPAKNRQAKLCQEKLKELKLLNTTIPNEICPEGMDSFYLYFIYLLYIFYVYFKN